MEQTVGQIRAIHRYPVKSFRGHSLPEAKVERYGLYGDRSYAFLDETRPGKYITAKQVPQLVEYDASFTDQPRDDSRFPHVSITSPDGTTYAWDDPALLTEIEAISKRKLKPVAMSPQTDEMMAFDQAHLLLVTDASVRALEDMWGNALDYMRFRPNLLLTLVDDQPFSEISWIGKRMTIGEVELEIQEQCERCSMVTIDPTTYAKSPDLLRLLAREHAACFGVYAAAVQTGVIRVGDPAILQE